jgi:hypothetical protein
MKQTNCYKSILRRKSFWGDENWAGIKACLSGGKEPKQQKKKKRKRAKQELRQKRKGYG